MNTTVWVGTAIWLGVGWLARTYLKNRREAEVSARNTKAIQGVASLSVGEARSRISPLFRNPDEFDVSYAELPQDVVERLSDDLQELLRIHPSLYFKAVGNSVGGPDIGPSETQPEMIRIGREADRSEVCVKPHEPTVYCLRPSARLMSEIGDTYPSVYHYLLARYLQSIQIGPKTPFTPR